MTGILRIETRRSAALWGALLLVAAGAAVLLDEPAGWLDGWMSVAATQRGDGLLAWPLALAVGAWQARARHLAGMAELAGSTALPAWRRVLPLSLVLGAGAAAAYLLVWIAAALHFAGGAGYHPPQALLVVAVGAVSMVCGTCLGLALGRAVPHVMTAPAAAVAGLALLAGVQSASERLPWLTHALSPTLPRTLFTVQDLDLLTISPRVSLAQAAWLGALAVTGTALFAAGDRRARLLAAVPAVLGATVALALVPRGEAAPGVSFDAEATRPVCTADAPRVCVTRWHAAALAQVTPPARQALAALGRLPGGGPTAAVEDVTPFRSAPSPAPGTALLPRIGGIGDSGIEPATFAPRLVGSYLNPANCPGEATAAATAWLLGTGPDGRDPAESPERAARIGSLRSALGALPPAEALRRIGALREASLRADVPGGRCPADLDRALLDGRPA